MRRSSRQQALAEKKKLQENEVSLYIWGGDYFDVFVIHLSNKNVSYIANVSFKESNKVGIYAVV